jgi:hypothetical protein
MEVFRILKKWREESEISQVAAEETRKQIALH